MTELAVFSYYNG